MGRFLAGVGLATVFAWFFRRRRKPQTTPSQPNPAEELKQKLAETRAEAPGAQPEPKEPEPETEAAGLDERRRDVHERARASIDKMRGQPPEG